MQEGRPVACYSRKLTAAQRNYTVMEKELLAIVLLLLEFRTTLLGADLRIYTDHRNLTFANFNTQRVLRWRCFVEEYAPKLFYLEGKLNVLADAFSRLPKFDDVSVPEGKGAKSEAAPELLDACHAAQEPALFECLQHLPEKEEHCDTQDSFIDLPVSDENPLSLEWLKETQEGDQELMKMPETDAASFQLRQFQDNIKLVCRTEPGADKDQDWKICLSDEAVDPSIAWFHKLLNHPGKDRLFQGMGRFCHPHLRKKISEFKCDACQRFKMDLRGAGHLPARDVRAAPWEQVDVDLIGPWSVEVKTGKVFEFSALTSIDRVTGLAELIRIDEKTAMHVAAKFDESWLSRCPRPMACCHDNGGEFKAEFLELLTDFGIKDVPTTSRNPASNGICERMHQTVGSVLRTLILENKPRTLKHAQIVIDQALATAAHAVRTNVNQATGHTPGAMAFHRDMLLNVPLVVNLLAVRDKRQVAVDKNLQRVNARRTSHDCQPNQRVLKKLPSPAKMAERWEGPHRITKVHVNGNVTIELKPGVTERINIRRVKPCHEPTQAPPVLAPHPTQPQPILGQVGAV